MYIGAGNAIRYKRPFARLCKMCCKFRLGGRRPRQIESERLPSLRHFCCHQGVLRVGVNNDPMEYAQEIACRLRDCLPLVSIVGRSLSYGRILVSVLVCCIFNGISCSRLSGCLCGPVDLDQSLQLPLFFICVGSY